MAEQKLIKVTNRELARVGYYIPDLDVRRQFSVGETKSISFEELEKLSFIPGGKALIKNYLLVQDKEVLNKILNEKIEPEYFYTEAEIRKLLTSGTIGQLEDCLNFAPEGTISLVQKLAVELKINDINKRDLIFKKTGFNVTKAIENLNDEDKEEKAPVVRKAAPVVTVSAPVKK